MSVSKIRDVIESICDRLRTELFEVEITELIERGYSEPRLLDFLVKSAFVYGLFTLISAIRRSNMLIDDFKRSFDFLLFRHKRIGDIISNELPRGSRILEIGCGRGLNSCELALRGYEVYAVDVSERMLKIAKKLARRMGQLIHFKLASGTELTYEDNFFDAVIYVWTLHEMSLDDIKKSLAEAYRVLKRRGMIYIVDQEGVAPFDEIKSIAENLKLEKEYEGFLSPVYDHGRTSKAILIKYRKI